MNNSVNLTVQSNEPSLFASSLQKSICLITEKYGLASIGCNQVSLWFAEALKDLILQKFNIKNQTMTEILDYSVESLSSITIQDINYCVLKSNPNLKFNINEQSIIDWLLNKTYITRISQIMIDSLLSEPLAPMLEISPSGGLKLPYSTTFAIISEKTTLITHQIYPFIVGRNDSSINIIGVHTSWIIPNSNLATRAIVYNIPTNSFIEGDLESPLCLNYAFIVELNKEEEIQAHKRLTTEYESAGLNVINPALLSNQRADDKLWIRQHKPIDIKIPNYIYLTDLKSIDKSSIDSFLKTANKGVVLQPSANTTESTSVKWFPTTEQSNNIFKAAQEIIDKNNSVLISEFKGNVTYKEAPVVFRFNVAAGSHVTTAAYIGTNDNKIVGLKGTNLTNGGYCERLDKVLDNLFLETTNEKVLINSTDWTNLLNTARSIAKTVNLPLVGIDLVLEFSDTKCDAFVLEVNARPGTLIFGEELIFNESNSAYSLMRAPVNEHFWSLILSSQSSIDKQRIPKTLLQWKHLISSDEFNQLKLSQYYELNPLSSPNYTNSFLHLMGKRYGVKDLDLIIDRIDCFTKTIDDSILAGFDVNKTTSIIFSNGRDRYYGGHTDLLGLGGPTINATTESEIITVIQQSDDSFIHVTNSSTEYKPLTFNYDELLLVLNALETNIAKWGEQVWDANEWTSYLKGSLTYMLSSDFTAQNRVKEFLINKNKWIGFHIHFNSSGRLHLQSRVGSSSSSALTSAFVLGLNKIFNMQLNNNELSQTDYGEFYLGKTAGCADKTTILNAIKGELIAVSSIPESFIQSISLPSSIVIIMANSNIPRLNSLNGKRYLLNSNLYTADKVDLIFKWGQSIMRRFGSFVFVHSVQVIVQSLINEHKYKQANITSAEAEAVLTSLGVNTEQNAPTDSSQSLINSGGKSLLRELCTNGELENNMPDLSGYQNRFKRYNLIFRLLKLLPETATVSIGGNEDVINPRKSTLYGISEIERCYSYMSLMDKLNSATVNSNDLDHLLDLVRWAHNGDRAIVDYRNDFRPTAWASDIRNLVSDQILDSWILNPSEELTNKSGGFERSLPELDEWADTIDKTFHRQAAFRVSAAGLGGTVCIHAISSISADIISWLKDKGLTCRIVRPGPSCEVF